MKPVQVSVVFSVFLAACAAQIPSGCESQTTTGYRYTSFFNVNPDASGELQMKFRVMAKSDAHVAFTASPIAQNPMYEIVIGASGNNFTDLRRTMTGRSIFAVRTPSVLSSDEYRGFWVVIRHGEIEIGREGETLPYFYWKDPEPLHVHYYALSSWSNTLAKWIHKCPAEDSGNPSAAGGTALDQSDENANLSAVDRFRNSLIRGYNKDMRPFADQRSFSVAISMSMIHFDLDDATSRFIVDSWFRMSWRDERLQWNASEFQDLSMIHVPAGMIWQPTIILYNGADARDLLHYGDTPVRLYSDGSVIWLPPSTLVAICEFDLQRWPFDTQTCTLKMGSYTHDGDNIDLTIYNNMTEVDKVRDVYQENLRWRLVSTEARIDLVSYDLFPEQHPEIQFTFVVKRNLSTYVSTILTPAVVIVLLTLTTLLLPPSAWEKTMTGLIDLVITVLLLMHTSQVKPLAEGETPTIVSFYSRTMVLIAISVTLSMAAVVITRLPALPAPPRRILRALYGTAGKLLCLGSFYTQATSGKGATDQDGHGMDYVSQINTEADSSQIADDNRRALLTTADVALKAAQREWLMLACAVDRLVFVVYCFAFGLMMSVYF